MSLPKEDINLEVKQILDLKDEDTFDQLIFRCYNGLPKILELRSHLMSIFHFPSSLLFSSVLQWFDSFFQQTYREVMKISHLIFLQFSLLHLL